MTVVCHKEPQANRVRHAVPINAKPANDAAILMATGRTTGTARGPRNPAANRAANRDDRRAHASHPEPAKPPDTGSTQRLERSLRVKASLAHGGVGHVRLSPFLARSATHHRNLPRPPRDFLKRIPHLLGLHREPSSKRVQSITARMSASLIISSSSSFIFTSVPA